MQQLALNSPPVQPQAGWRPEHRIKTARGIYTFGSELNTRPREAEIRKAIEWAESGTPEAFGTFVRDILPTILIMDPDEPPPERIERGLVLNLDLAALFKTGREAEFHKVFEGLEQAKPEDRGRLISLRFQELALRQFAPATPAVKSSEPAPKAVPVPVEAVPVRVVSPPTLKTRKPRTRKPEQTPVYITHPHLPLSERILMYEKPLSPEQLAAEVDVNRNTIYKWVAAATLPVRRAGSRLKFDQGPTSTWAKNREFLPIEMWGESVTA